MFSNFWKFNQTNDVFRSYAQKRLGLMLKFNFRWSFLKSISPKADFVKTKVFGVQKGTKRSTGPNVNLLGPKKENPPPKHVLMPMGIVAKNTKKHEENRAAK